MSTLISSTPIPRIAPNVERAAAVGNPAISQAPLAAPEHAQAKPEIHYDPSELRRNLEEAVQRLNEQMQQSARKLNFSIDEQANRTVITVRSSETGEVVRQIPNETVLNLAHNLEQIKGMLHNRTS